MIRKIWLNRFNMQLIVTIPKENEEGVEAGDWVEIKRCVPPLKRRKCNICSKKYQDHTVDELHKHGLIK